MPQTRIAIAGKVVLATFEAIILAEIAWYTITGDALHEVIADALNDALDSLAHSAEIARTRAMIRDLPETK